MVWYVAYTGEMKKEYEILVENLSGRDRLRDQSVDGRVI
jgi:hypothetical protein